MSDSSPVPPSIVLRHALAIGGFACAIFAVVRDDRLVGWVGIGLLAAALLLRLASGRRGRRPPNGDNDDRDVSGPGQ